MLGFSFFWVTPSSLPLVHWGKKKEKKRKRKHCCKLANLMLIMDNELPNEFAESDQLYYELTLKCVRRHFEGLKCCCNTLLTYLQFSVIKWAKQHPGQNPFDVKSDEAIQI